MVKSVIALTFFLSIASCRATVQVPIVPETVGSLSSSLTHVTHVTHVTSMPVHESTNLDPTSLVVETSEPSTNQSVTDDNRPTIETKQAHGF